MLPTVSTLSTIDLNTFEGLEDYEHGSFWSSCRSFFLDNGYELYTPQSTPFYASYTPYHEPVSQESPIYASFSRRVSANAESIVSSRKIMYAQDRECRDVVIKLVETDSAEHRIHARLMSCADFNKPESFPCIIPTLDILRSPHHFSFLIMPRWGDAPCVPEFRNIREFLSFIENILQGLDFLHSCRIVHLDIDFRNILVNQFTHTQTHDIECPFWDEEARATLRNKDQIRYCLFDFDLSQIFYPDAPIANCLLTVASVKGRGSPDLHPKDVDCVGPLDPFKFDIACMGNMLSRYNHVIPAWPLLAPLLDRMTTDHVTDRFTASEALSFCRFIRNSLTSNDLDIMLSPFPVLASDEKQPGRWELLPAHFVAKWYIGGHGWVDVCRDQ